MAIEIVRPLSQMQRELIAPHLEAYRRFERIINTWRPEPGLDFDTDTLCFYRTIPEPVKAPDE